MTFHRPFGSAVPVRALVLSLCAHAFVLLQGASHSVLDRRVSHFDARLIPPQAPAQMLTPVSRLAGAPVKASAPILEAAAAPSSEAGTAVQRTPFATAAATGSGLEQAPVTGEGARAYRLSIARGLQQVQQQSPELKGVGDPRMIRFVLSLGGRGELQGLRIVESSGSDALDAAATSVIRSAISLALLPETLHGKAFSIEVAMEVSP